MRALSDNIKAILAIIVVITSLAYFYMCSIRNIKPDPQILIAMVSIVTMVLGYYFGSSSSSSKKDDSLAHIAQQPTIEQADTVNMNGDSK